MYIMFYKIRYVYTCSVNYDHENKTRFIIAQVRFDSIALSYSLTNIC